MGETAETAARARGARWDARSPSWTLTALVGQTRSAANAAGSKRPTGPEPFPPSQAVVAIIFRAEIESHSQCIGLLAGAFISGQLYARFTP